MSGIPMIVGRNVAKARKAAGLTQQALADQMGVPQPRISEVEAHRRRPSWEELADLAAALGVTVAEFFDGV